MSATLDSHAYARNDERAGTPAPDLIFPLVIARCNECCDVAIEAKPHFAMLDSHGHCVPSE